MGFILAAAIAIPVIGRILSPWIRSGVRTPPQVMERLIGRVVEAREAFLRHETAKNNLHKTKLSTKRAMNMVKGTES